MPPHTPFILPIPSGPSGVAGSSPPTPCYRVPPACFPHSSSSNVYNPYILSCRSSYKQPFVELCTCGVKGRGLSVAQKSFCGVGPAFSCFSLPPIHRVPSPLPPTHSFPLPSPPPNPTPSWGLLHTPRCGARTQGSLHRALSLCSAVAFVRIPKFLSEWRSPDSPAPNLGPDT